MAMCTTGNLSIKSTAGLCRSICAAVIQAGGTGTGGLRSLTTQTFAPQINDGSMSQFYGYNPVSGSLSLSISVTEIFQSQITFNTITASGAWTASEVDPDNIINSFTSSGSGSGKISAAGSSLMPIFIAEACIIYCLTSAPAIRDCWILFWGGS
jgi:hypothetical protein